MLAWDFLGGFGAGEGGEVCEVSWSWMIVRKEFITYRLRVQRHDRNVSRTDLAVVWLPLQRLEYQVKGRRLSLKSELFIFCNFQFIVTM